MATIDVARSTSEADTPHAMPSSAAPCQAAAAVRMAAGKSAGSDAVLLPKLGRRGGNNGKHQNF
eukprot:scaffold67729_cov70-Phaeocystis_antarctica.AAC.4